MEYICKVTSRTNHRWPTRPEFHRFPYHETTSYNKTIVVLTTSYNKTIVILTTNYNKTIVVLTTSYNKSIVIPTTSYN